MAVDDSDRILEFVEKPENPPHMPGDETQSLASMGIYVFKTEYLIEAAARRRSFRNVRT